MLQAGNDLYLAREAFQKSAVLQELHGQHFNCHLAPDGGLYSPVHGRHATMTDFFDYLILAQLASRHL